MMVNFVRVRVMAVVPSLRMRPIICCCSSSTNINTEALRSQLDQLHAEADTTRAKGM